MKIAKLYVISLLILVSISIGNPPPRMKVVWAHMCLSKELQSLHPRVHSHIMEKFLNKYPNLYVDISWDILANMLLLNYDEMIDVKKYSTEHPDIHEYHKLWNHTHIYDEKIGVIVEI